MKKAILLFKVISMLPGLLYVGAGLLVGIGGFWYFAAAEEYVPAFKALAAGFPVALAGMVLFLPNTYFYSSRVMQGVGLVALSILLHHASGVLFIIDRADQGSVVLLIVTCLLMGVVSFLLYSREKQKRLSPALAWLCIPLVIGLFGSGNPQWHRLIYMYQAYLDPWSPGPPNRPHCPRTYTGTWTEWYPNGKKKMEKNLRGGIYHGSPSKIDWYPNGQMKCSIHHVDGKKLYTVWYENGIKKQKTDPADGTVIYWDESGKKREGPFLQMHSRVPQLPYREAHYKNGKLHGKLTEWDNQREIARIAQYENGQLIENEE
jgi:hypothetical protein